MKNSKLQSKIQHVLFAAVLGFLLLILFSFSDFFLSSISAQEEPTDGNDTSKESGNEENDEASIEAFILDIGKDLQTITDKKIIFDIAESKIPREQGENVYDWNFGDGGESNEEKVEHVYSQKGNFLVRFSVTNNLGTKTDEKMVRVYERVVPVIVDSTVDPAQLDELSKKSSQNDVLLLPLFVKDKEARANAKIKLVNLLIDNKDELARADVIVDWTSSEMGLSALNELPEASEDLSEFQFDEKVIVSVADKNLSAKASFAQATFDILRPKNVLVMESRFIEKAVTVSDNTKIFSEVQANRGNVRLIGIHSERGLSDLRPTNFMAFLVNNINNKGVPLETILLILMLPVIATFVAMTRQVLGIKAFGIYVPTIITLSFAATSLKYGLAIFFVILVGGTVMRYIVRKLSLLYLPRIALVLSGVSFAILFMLALGAYTDRTGLITQSIFPMLVMIILAEKFITAQIEKGFSKALMLTGETLLISIVGYYLLNWEYLRTLILGYPELILLTIVINLLLGKWTGLRLSEYIRFRKIAKHAEYFE